ncbi:Palmitoyltransferase AKR1 [Golovinomyces cichoracearum]|uniref:Palmitoyltransferase n=1 Tax=Golovinomyces cichoracearum TaxID=62708 RepID=A0A420IYM2_9PEZI|nr:Palmitoyltransferase AKR1 [Golovinomyces cichoracearum]
MSHVVSRNTTTVHNAPTTPNGKSSVVEPKLSDGERVELTEMLLSEPEADLNEDIMQLARLGDIRGIERLYQSGNFNSSYCDREGITPLHWAAINNQYMMCEFLINEGADVNKKGGESAATPAMWAAQRCHYYVVNLLLKNGADLFATEIQGYNILHLATFEGSMFLLVLLLHQGIDVDIPDLQGHTCLMWAAYKGFPMCVDLFLRWGANIHITDETGFTALHWALVKGSQGCIQKLLEYGADRFAQTSTGKTPAVTAHEMKTEHVWHRALLECGYDEKGNPLNINFPLSGVFLKNKRAFMNRIFFLFPFLIIWIMITIVSHMIIFVGIPLALFAGYTLQWLAQQIAVYAPSDMKKMHMTPWLAGIFAGTLFLVGLNWLTTLLPETYSSNSITNLLFGISYILCAYFYICTMVYEPGFVPKLDGISQQKVVIDGLLNEWKFDEYNFCIPCMIRQPLRSKHCRQCGRCVAKHDHHCPWVYNCIGINNHRHFLLYLITLELGIIMLIKITIGYFENKLSNDTNSTCNLLASSLCKVVNTDSYTLILVFWAMLQLTWVSMLIFVQLIQISRATTTWENMRGTNYDRPSKASEAIMSALTTNTVTGASHGRNTSISTRNHHHHKRGCFDTWKRILGVDTFVETALSRKERRRNANPFSAGCLVNCQDFWCDSAPVFGKREDKSALLWGQPVDYTSIYEIPDITVRRHHERERSTYQRVSVNDVVE